jgi:DNA-binding MarR family transcriptional regulator
MTPQSPGSLPVLLSQALVAFTIEMDNEAERRLPHSTTRHGEDDRDDDGRRALWLTSYAMYANVLRYVDDNGITVERLAERARTNRLQLGGLRRWRYLTIRPPAGQPLRTPPQPGCMVRLTPGGRRACTAWAGVPAVVEGRWRDRFGGDAVAGLRRALVDLFDALPFDPPAYLPIVFLTQNGKAEPTPPRSPEAARSPAEKSRTAPGHTDLSALLSGVLLCFTHDFEADTRISMPIGANTLRVLQSEHEAPPERVRDLPRLTGVSKEANAMSTGWLERHGCAEVVADPSGGRGKVVRLTPKGRGAQAKHRRVRDATEAAWRDAYGAAAVERLLAALAPMVGDGMLASSPLAAGLEPSEGNWRAAVRRPETLPHYPMVLHRGGYPDGS